MSASFLLVQVYPLKVFKERALVLLNCKWEEMNVSGKHILLCLSFLKLLFSLVLFPDHCFFRTVISLGLPWLSVGVHQPSSAS